jgi:geranylgeranyl diphosphate synthase type II
MTDFDQKLGYYHGMVMQALPDFLPEEDSAPRSLLEAMAYALLGAGKRVRAILTLAFYEAFGGRDTQAALPFAAALEMIHAYSLIHDDLPCMDDDDLRRGKPACHIIFGEATALLAGDALLTLAFETVSSPQARSAFGAEKLVEAMSVLAKAAGPSGMVGGQVMDLENEGAEVSADELQQADEQKTGALIRAACMLGAILAGAGAAGRKAADVYAAKLGLAFQVVDDILDQTGDAEKLGKPLGSDEEQGKTTYVSAYGLDRAREIAGSLTAEAAAALKDVQGETAFLAGFVDFLCNRNY